MDCVVVNQTGPTYVPTILVLYPDINRNKMKGFVLFWIYLFHVLLASEEYKSLWASSFSKSWFLPKRLNMEARVSWSIYARRGHDRDATYGRRGPRMFVWHSPSHSRKQSGKLYRTWLKQGFGPKNLLNLSKSWMRTIFSAWNSSLHIQRWSLLSWSSCLLPWHFPSSSPLLLCLEDVYVLLGTQRTNPYCVSLLVLSALWARCRTFSIWHLLRFVANLE